MNRTPTPKTKSQLKQAIAQHNHACLELLKQQNAILIDALKAAKAQLDYCGYGDRWERAYAKESKLEEQIGQALSAAEQGPNQGDTTARINDKGNPYAMIRRLAIVLELSAKELDASFPYYFEMILSAEKARKMLATLDPTYLPAEAESTETDPSR